MHYKRSKMKRLLDRISEATRGIVTIIGRLFGIKEKGGLVDSSRFLTAGWVFLLGVPVGLILFGTAFPISIWFSSVIGILMLANLDEALILLSSYLGYWMDGVIME
jgi:hypothetical protein